MKRPGIAIFARAPVPGSAKTRLIPALGADRAAEIAATLLQLTVARVTEFWPGEVYLYVTPDSAHPLFKQLAADFHVHLRVQAEGDLGTRMLATLNELIASHGAGAVIGSDVPHCPGHVIERAYELLARGGDVIGPCEDGGYYLIGMQAAPSSLFDGITWGTDTVLRETQRRADAAGIEIEILTTLNDVDDYAGLLAAARELPALARLVPAVVEFPNRKS
jgi:rSAM/selenodomain-associated transferase 1